MEFIRPYLDAYTSAFPAVLWQNVFSGKSNAYSWCVVLLACLCCHFQWPLWLINTNKNTPAIRFPWIKVNVPLVLFSSDRRQSDWKVIRKENPIILICVYSLSLCIVNCLGNFVYFLTVIQSEASLNLCAQERKRRGAPYLADSWSFPSSFSLFLLCNCKHIYSSFVAGLFAAASR